MIRKEWAMSKDKQTEPEEITEDDLENVAGGSLATAFVWETPAAQVTPLRVTPVRVTPIQVTPIKR